MAIDQFGNFALHTTYVFSLDVTDPEINGPDRIFFLEGAPNQQIEWEVFDNNPGNFTIYRNGYFVKNGSWIDTDKITFPLDNLEFGAWNYTLMLEDQYNHTSYNSISVTVGITKETTTNATVNDLLFGFDSNIVIGGALIGVGTAVVGGIVFLVRRR